MTMESGQQLETSIPRIRWWFLNPCSRMLTWHTGRNEVWLAWMSQGLGGFQTRNQWIYTHLCLHYIETANGRKTVTSSVTEKITEFLSRGKSKEVLHSFMQWVFLWLCVWRRRGKAKQKKAAEMDNFRVRWDKNRANTNGRAKQKRVIQN